MNKLSYEIKNLLVSTPSGGWQEVQAVSLEFEMDTEGSFFCRFGMVRMDFPIPHTLQEYFVVGTKNVLQCTWDQDSVSFRPIAIVFEGELLLL